MRKLSASAYQRARAHLLHHARALERARFAREFEAGPADAVLDALAAYQNSDGGFGQALEPDVRLPDSSAIATLTGLEILREIGASSGCAAVQRALAWVVARYDADLPGWRAVPAEVDQHPRAPWWNHEHHCAGGATDPFLMPGARLLSHLQHWSEIAPESLVGAYTETYRAHILALSGPVSADGLYYASTVEDPRTRDKLCALALATVSREPADWTGYVAKPLKLAPEPDGLFARTLSDIVAVNLDWEIDEQASDGAWEPNWSWFGAYPAEWEIARSEWRGELTLRNLRSLRAFGRIEAL